MAPAGVTACRKRFAAGLLLGLLAMTHAIDVSLVNNDMEKKKPFFYQAPHQSGPGFLGGGSIVTFTTTPAGPPQFSRPAEIGVAVAGGVAAAAGLAAGIEALVKAEYVSTPAPTQPPASSPSGPSASNGTAGAVGATGSTGTAGNVSSNASSKASMPMPSPRVDEEEPELSARVADEPSARVEYVPIKKKENTAAKGSSGSSTKPAFWLAAVSVICCCCAIAVVLGALMPRCCKKPKSRKVKKTTAAPPAYSEEPAPTTDTMPLIAAPETTGPLTDSRVKVNPAIDMLNVQPTYTYTTVAPPVFETVTAPPVYAAAAPTIGTYQFAAPSVVQPGIVTTVNAAPVPAVAAVGPMTMFSS